MGEPLDIGQRIAVVSEPFYTLGEVDPERIGRKGEPLGDLFVVVAVGADGRRSPPSRAVGCWFRDVR